MFHDFGLLDAGPNIVLYSLFDFFLITPCIFDIIVEICYILAKLLMINFSSIDK